LGDLSFVYNYVVIDFEGVRSVSEAAANELFVKLLRSKRARAINLEPDVARTIRNVLRLGG